MDKWKEIWNKKERANKIVLETLIKADGFDSGAGSFCVDEWIEYTQQFFNKLNIEENQSVFDVGCGSGAFVFPLYLKNNKVGGADYSMVLIDLANTIMKNSHFEVNEATKIDTNKKFDHVISHSVFHYFKDLDYAKTVIEKMLDKANKKIGIFDINDKAKEEKYHKIRMEGISKEEYKKNIQDLSICFMIKIGFYL